MEPRVGMSSAQLPAEKKKLKVETRVCVNDAGISTEKRGQETMKSYAKKILMATFAVLLMGAFAAADTPGAHPAYLHALTDLRHARAHLGKMTPNERLN